MRLEYHFELTSSGDLNITVNPESTYMKTIPFALELEAALKKKVPFKFEKQSDTRVAVLGGKSRQKMLSVEMTIIPSKISKADAIDQLKNEGFAEGLIETLA